MNVEMEGSVFKLLNSQSVIDYRIRFSIPILLEIIMKSFHGTSNNRCAGFSILSAAAEPPGIAHRDSHAYSLSLAG
jgi:hypothetical protein